MLLKISSNSSTVGALYVNSSFLYVLSDIRTESILLNLDTFTKNALHSSNQYTLENRSTEFINIFKDEN